METQILHKTGREALTILTEILSRHPEKVVDVIVRLNQESISEEQNKTKGKWAKIAEKISKESPLHGAGEELIKASKVFRESFSFKELNLKE